MIVVRARNCFYKATHRETRSGRALREGTVTIVVIQLARVGITGINTFVPDKHVEPSVAVVIEPRLRFGWMKAQQPGFFGYIGECAVAIIPKEQLGMRPPLLIHAPRKIQMSPAVIVVVGLLNVQAADHPR